MPSWDRSPLPPNKTKHPTHHPQESGVYPGSHSNFLHVICHLRRGVFEKAGVQTVVCSKGADSVDFALVNRALVGDVVITQDYGLAGMCLARK